MILHGDDGNFDVQDPSELRNRRRSANSSGVLQAKKTSREVPNSMTVLSVNSAGLPASINRASCTGIHKGIASGKKRANPPTGLASRAFRAVAVA